MKTCEETKETLKKKGFYIRTRKQENHTFEDLSKESIRTEDKEYLTLEIKKRESQSPFLFAIDLEDETYLLYSDTLREWVEITQDREYYQPYIEFIQSKLEMIITRRR